MLCSENSNSEAMKYQLGVPAACVAVVVYAFLRRRRRLSVIRDVPGPVNPSWIFGMLLEGQSDPFTLFQRSMTLSAKFQDTSGIFREKKPEEQRGSSSRTLGTSFVGTVRFGCVLSLIKQTPVARTLSIAELTGLYVGRKIACGLRTLRLSITSSRNLVICTRSRRTLRNGQHCCPVAVSCGHRVSSP